MAASPDLQSFADMDMPSTSTASQPIDIRPSSSYRLSNHWESVDFNQSPGFAYTPSYVGSFGSQQDANSVLNNWGERESTAVHQSHNPSGDFYDDVKYEPEAYGDQSNSASPYMLMNDQGTFHPMGGNDDSLFAQSSDNGGPMIGYAAGDQQHEQYSPRREIFNAASPASSIIDVQANQGGRSRASSVSSYHGAQSSPYLDYSGGVNEQFDKLTFDGGLENNTTSSSWNQQHQKLSHRRSYSADLNSSPALQPLQPLDFSAPITQEQATSPPTLMIPTDVGRAQADPPSLQTNALGDLSIHLVPATPVSAGGAGSSGAPFQRLLADLNRNRQQAAAFDRGNAANSGPLPSIASFHTAMEQSGLGGGDSAAAPRSSQDPMSWGSILSASGQSQGTASTLPQQSSRVYHHGYNVPLIPNYNAPQLRESSPSMSTDLQQQPSQQSPPFAHHTQSDSVLSTSSGFNGLGAFTPTSEPAFTPNSEPGGINLMGLDDMSSFLAAPILATRSRSKSDVSGRPPLWSITPPGDGSSSSTAQQQQQQGEGSSSSFESFTYSDMSQHQQRPNLGHVYQTTPGPTMDQTLGLGDFSSVKRSNSDGGRHKRSVKSEDLTSLRGGRFLPNGNTVSEADFVRSVTMADGSLAPVDPRVGGAAGPTRRRGSGGHERNSSLSSLRSTPYSMRPSPHTSPGVSPQHSPTPAPPMSLPNVMEQHQALHTQQPTPAIVSPNIRVERPLVTTPATKTASANRRRAEANFVCPVPNCGSTFTRHFNLRGHMRSHNEERPFKCKWPGCEKGFARQHDCKRHEALHLNIRPYTCEGCQKTFARMDALNRHLRSEGGVDCQKHHQGFDGFGLPGSGDDESDTKPEDTSAMWNQTGTIMM